MRQTPGHKRCGRRVFGSIVFGEAIVRTRREADVVTFGIGIGDDDLDVEHGVSDFQDKGDPLRLDEEGQPEQRSPTTPCRLKLQEASAVADSVIRANAIWRKLWRT